MQALERLLRIIEAVAAVPTGLNPSEVASRVDLSTSTVSRMMAELVGHHILEKSDATGRYTLGDRLLQIVQSSTWSIDGPEVIRDLMTSLRDLSGETVSLNVRVGAQRVCIETVPSQQPVARFIPLGMAQPLIDSASGEVLLSGLDETELDSLLLVMKVSRPTAKQLKRRLDRTRADGYAIYQGKLVLGVTGVSALVRNFGPGVGALSISGPSERFTKDAVRRVLPELLSVAKQISELSRFGR